MTGQSVFDSRTDGGPPQETVEMDGEDAPGTIDVGRDQRVGLLATIGLINERAVADPAAKGAAARRALAVDPQTIERMTRDDATALRSLAVELLDLCTCIVDGDVDTAATTVNALLAENSARPHLAKEGGRWRLHHHPADAEVVPMWTAIAADAFARVIGNDECDRVGICAAEACGRLYVDASKNRSRRFCSTTCQNRVKAAAFRRRRAAPSPT
jgi:predicted RNA-binding Zn ribbon-like protein